MFEAMKRNISSYDGNRELDIRILWNMPEQVTFQVDAMSELFRTISTC